MLPSRTIKLTTAYAIKAALPHGKQEAIVFDGNLPGFGLRIREGGKRTWIVQYRLGKKQRRLTIGNVGVIDADEARRRAKQALSKVRLGIDPQLERSDVRVQASVTLKTVIADYLARYAEPRQKPKTFQDTTRYLQVGFTPLHETPLQKLRRADIARQLGELAKSSGPYATNRARAAISALFSWAIGEGLADANPAVGTNKAIDEISRDRVLSQPELTHVWRLSGDGDYAAIVKLAILTGQRREEIGGMLWSELDLIQSMWKIGAVRTKNGLSHSIPLSKLAVQILSGLIRQEDRDFVFGSQTGSFQGWSNAKAALDARIQEAFSKGPAPSQPFVAWRFHDIRRTVATRLGDIGAQPHVIEAILNHISGSKAGVAGVYNRAAYSDEKRVALALWSEKVSAEIA